jgi:hypothetical protein
VEAVDGWPDRVLDRWKKVVTASWLDIAMAVRHLRSSQSKFDATVAP